MSPSLKQAFRENPLLFFLLLITLVALPLLGLCLAAYSVFHPLVVSAQEPPPIRSLLPTKTWVVYRVQDRWGWTEVTKVQDGGCAVYVSTVRTANGAGTSVALGKDCR